MDDYNFGVEIFAGNDLPGHNEGSGHGSWNKHKLVSLDKSNHIILF